MPRPGVNACPSRVSKKPPAFETYFTVWANVFQIQRKLSAGERSASTAARQHSTTAIQLARAFGATVRHTRPQPSAVPAGARRAACHQLQGARFRRRIPSINLLLIVGAAYTPRNIERHRARLQYKSPSAGRSACISLASVMHSASPSPAPPPPLIAEKGNRSRTSRRMWPLLESARVKCSSIVFPSPKRRGAPPRRRQHQQSHPQVMWGP